MSFRILIIVALFFASPAFAEQPEDKGPVRKSDIQSFVVMDCGDGACGREPQEIGRMVSMVRHGDRRLGDEQTALTLVTITNSQGIDKEIAIAIAPSRIPYQIGNINDNGGVFFKSTDCDISNPNEPGYIQRAGPPFFGGFLTIAVVGVINNSNIRFLWVATGEPEQVIVANSVRVPNEKGCQQLPEPVNVNSHPAELVDSDLHETYKPPFTLELK